jgi:NAD(P)-dependent dehydrogenase (short-subunit alcohol dehydrogenase family)
MEIPFANTIAIVPGDNIGIGRAVSLAFARCGAEVALTCYPHRQEGEKTAGAITPM